MVKRRFQANNIIIGAVVVLLLIGVLIVVLDWKEVRRLIGAADWYLAAPALVFTAISYLSLSYSFAMLSRIFGIGLTRRDLLEIGFVSIVVGHIMSFAGVPEYSLRLLLMKARGLKGGDILAPSVFDSYLNNLAMFTLFPVGVINLLLNHPLTRSETTGFGLSMGLVVAGLIVAGAMLFQPSLRATVLRSLNRVWRILTHHDMETLATFDAALIRGIAVIRGRAYVLGILIALIAVDWACTTAALYFCFDALGEPVKFGVLVTGFAIGVVAGVLSMIPGGIGVQEGSMAAVYALLGVPLEQAILAAILFRVVYYFVPFFVSLGFYRRLLSSSPGQPTGHFDRALHGEK